MPKEKRRMVNLRESTHGKLDYALGMLDAKTGQNYSRDQVVDRALDILIDAYGRGAWLSPAEAGPIIRARHQREIARMFGQFIDLLMPEAKLEGIHFDQANGQAIIRLIDLEDPGKKTADVPLPFQGVGDFPQGSQG